MGSAVEERTTTAKGHAWSQILAQFSSQELYVGFVFAVVPVLPSPQSGGKAEWRNAGIVCEARSTLLLYVCITGSGAEKVALLLC